MALIQKDSFMNLNSGIFHGTKNSNLLDFCHYYGCHYDEDLVLNHCFGVNRSQIEIMIYFRSTEKTPYSGARSCSPGPEPNWSSGRKQRHFCCNHGTRTYSSLLNFTTNSSKEKIQKVLSIGYIKITLNLNFITTFRCHSILKYFFSIEKQHERKCMLTRRLHSAYKMCANFFSCLRN